MGLVRAFAAAPLIQEIILSVQQELVTLMGELAVDDEDRPRYFRDGYGVVSPAMADRLTAVVDDLEKNRRIVFKRWATPGATPGSAALDVARTTCRRAERRVIALTESSDYVNP